VGDTGEDGTLAGLAASVANIERRLEKLHSVVLKLRGPFAVPETDAAFAEAARPLVGTRRTLLNFERLFTLWQAARNVAHLDGAAAEVGTLRGGSAALLAQAFVAHGGGSTSPGRELHVVDTFEGHLDRKLTGHDPEQQRGKFNTTSYDDVRGFLSAYPQITVHKGDAVEVVAGWPERRFALVHLDVDLYLPTLECLDYFGPRLEPAGVIVLDDYDAPSCPGVRTGVEEYLRRSAARFQTWNTNTQQLVLVKR
jgi:hypothetical protein